MSRTYFFCGIGGSGMSALAVILLRGGNRVQGSDRSRDKGDTPDKFRQLEQEGAVLFPQDGSGVTGDVDVLVVSSAVEETIPDVRAAREKNIPIQKRAEILAGLFNASRGIAVGGTSGKTTVTGMIAHILRESGRDPSVMNGGQIVNFLEAGLPGNALCGGGDVFVAETDESDGSIALFAPAIAVLNNVTLDHKPLAELRPLFTDFLKKAKEGAVVNLDDPEAAMLAGMNGNTVTFSIDHPDARLRADDIRSRPDGVEFTVLNAVSGETARIALRVPGRHNVSNALAALAATGLAGVPLADAGRFLEGFKGIKRRFEVVGTAGGVTVIDDFAHNPDKIAATLRTLKELKGRVLAVFQPHGFGPTKMLKDGLVQVFAEYLSGDDVLFMPEIYYAGGTAEKSISSQDIVDSVVAAGKQARFLEKRDAIAAALQVAARPGDRIVIMGARDDTLPEFAAEVLAGMRKRAA